MDSESPPVWASGGTTKFLLGTDEMGRDMLSTMLYGMRISIIIGIGAVCLQAFIGIIVGLISGYIKRMDNILMRIADVQLSFSTYMIAIFIGAIFQMMFGVANYEKIAAPLLILIIGLAEWPQYARTVRASVLAESKKEYVEAARVIGLPQARIMWRHILPNTLSPVLVISTVQVANAIMSEAALSFLGLGMPLTKPSLGSLITAGFEYIFSGSWWITLFPGICSGRSHPFHQPSGGLAERLSESQAVQGVDVDLQTTRLLTVRDLTINFKLRRQHLTAVNQVSFDLGRGERLGIVGESGRR